MSWATLTLTATELKAGRENELSRFSDAELKTYIDQAKPDLQDDLRQALNVDPTTTAGATDFDTLADAEPRLLKRAWSYKALYLAYSDTYTGEDSYSADKLFQYEKQYNYERQNFRGLLTAQGRVSTQILSVYR